MQFCTKCGRARNEGAGFCTGCGNKFTDSRPATPGTVPAEPVAGSGCGARAAGPSLLSGGSPFAVDPEPGGLRSAETPDIVRSGGARDVAGSLDRRSFQRWLWPAAIAVVILAGGAVAGIMLTGGHHATHPHAAANSATAGGSPAAKTTPSAPQTATSPVPSTSQSSSPAGTGPVRMAPGLAGDPQAAPIVSLLDSYFAAINGRDYQGYTGLLTTQERQGLTAARFAGGFASTMDTGEMLIGISPADGVTVATVTFTSHQNPADSVNGHQACTDWRISLFLRPDGTGYLIGKPPSGYKASYAACT